MEFITNFNKEEKSHYEMCAQIADVKIIIQENACDEVGNSCPELLALYIEETESKKIESFWLADTMIKEEYRRKLKEKGWNVNDFIRKKLYFGCEKLYPELQER